MNKTKISAKIVADSLSPQGDRLTSLLITFPRIILSELLTHRMLSKNTSSSRAIPFNKMVEAVQKDPFIPIAWQKEHKGMQGTEYITDPLEIQFATSNWLTARKDAIRWAEALNGNNSYPSVTKQLCNRLLEPFMWTTMLITGSKEGWDNFFELRNPVYEVGHNTFKSKKEVLDYYSDDPNFPELRRYSDLDWLKINRGQAEIHMMMLAEKIYDAMNESTPKQLKAGDYHIPFEDKMSDLDIDKVFKAGSGPMNRQEVRIKTSVAMAARTSYTIVGEEKGLDYEAMIGLHDRLLAQDPPHSSPLEHCAKTMNNAEYESFYKGQIGLGGESGWCNNFKGFIPYRYMIDNGQL